MKYLRNVKGVTIEGVKSRTHKRIYGGKTTGMMNYLQIYLKLWNNIMK